MPINFLDIPPGWLHCASVALRNDGWRSLFRYLTYCTPEIAASWSSVVPLRMPKDNLNWPVSMIQLGMIICCTSFCKTSHYNWLNSITYQGTEITSVNYILLYRGFGPTLARAFLVNAAIFSVYEAAIKGMHGHDPADASLEAALPLWRMAFHF